MSRRERKHQDLDKLLLSVPAIRECLVPLCRLDVPADDR